MSNKREVWVLENTQGEPVQSSIHRHRLPGIPDDGGVFRYVPEPPTSEQIAQQLLGEMVELVGNAAPLAWAAAGDQERAQRWETIALEILERSHAVLARVRAVAPEESAS